MPGAVPGFTALARAYAASLAGDAFVTVALAGSLFFTVPVGEARPKVALYLVVTMAPFGLVAPVLGPLLDRARRHRTLLASASCVGRAVLCVLMARHLDSIFLYPEAFGVLVLIKGFAVAKSALVPWVTSDRAALVGANSRLALVGVVGGTVGAAVAVPMLRFAGAAAVLVVGAATYAVAALLAFVVPTMRMDTESAPSPGRRATRPAGIRLAAMPMGFLRGGVGFLVFLLAFALRRDGEPAWFYGLVIAASAVGGLAGVIVAPRLRRLVREEAVLVASLLVPLAASMVAARSEARPAALMVAAALGLGAAAGRAGFDALVQRDAPDSLWGRAFARYEASFQLAWVIGALVPVLVALSRGTGLVVLALGLGAGAFLYLGALAADSLVGSDETRHG